MTDNKGKLETIRRERDMLEKELHLIEKADPPQTAAIRIVEFSNKHDPMISSNNEWSDVGKHSGCCC